jgi:hypothetical protein
VRSFKREEILAASEHGLGWKAGRAQQENESRAGERPSEVPGARINQCWIPCVRRRTKRQALAHKTESRKRDKQKIIKKIPWLDAAVFACGNTKIKKLTWTKAREHPQRSGTCARNRGNRSQVAVVARKETKNQENQIDTARKFGTKISDVATEQHNEK